jgi:hypothetical protein
LPHQRRQRHTAVGHCRRQHHRNVCICHRSYVNVFLVRGHLWMINNWNASRSRNCTSQFGCCLNA